MDLSLEASMYTQQRFIRIALFLMVIGVIDSHTRASAQTQQPPLKPRQGWAQSHLDIGGSAGLGANTDNSLEKYTTDLSALVDVTLDPVWALRTQVERVEFGVPGFVGAAGVHDALRITRVSIGAKRATDESIHQRFRPYLLGNVGLYHFSSRAGIIAPATRIGGSGGIGFENLMGDGHAAFTGEVTLHAVHGPDRPGSDYSLFMVTYTFGFKARF
jgi:hypothetical protein